MPKPIAPLDASEVKKAGSVEAALRIRDGLARRAEALAREHTNSVTIRVIGRPPSINKLLGGKPKDRMTIKAEYQERCYDAWQRAGKPVIASPYKFKLHLHVSTTEFDRSNLVQGAVKSGLDAFVNCGMLAGDAWDDDVGPEGPHTREFATHDMVTFTFTHVGPRKKF